jgi:hypothetical protein
MAHVDVHSPPEEQLDSDPDTQMVACSDVASEIAWWVRAMCNGKRNEVHPRDKVGSFMPEADPAAPLTPWQMRSMAAKGRKEAPPPPPPLPSLHEHGDGFYLAVFGTYPDVLFVARSVFMQLLQAVSARKLVLAARYVAQKENNLGAAPGLGLGLSKAEKAAERAAKALADAAVRADELFLEGALAAMSKLVSAALDLAQLVLTPLEDTFCSVRKLGIGDFRFIETGERCVTESLRLLCAVFAACTSERPLGSPAPQPTGTAKPPPRGTRAPPAPPPQTRVVDDAMVEAGAVFGTEQSGPLLLRGFALLQSCTEICIDCVDNIPMQSALNQAVSTIAVYALQENARLLARRRVAAAEFATLKPIAKVLTDMFGGGAPAAEASPGGATGDAPETEQQRWDRLSAASKEAHRPVVAELIEYLAELVPSLLVGMNAHKEVPSLQYYGFMNLRMLFRLPFFKSNQLEEMLAEGGGAEDGPGALGAGVECVGGTTSISGGPSVLDLDGSLSMLSISEWRGAQVSNAGGVYSRERHRHNCRELLGKVRYIWLCCAVCAVLN